MARKTLKERREAALAKLDEAKERLAKLEDHEAARIGKVAVKAGLADIDVTDEQLASEFSAIVNRFRKKSVGGGESSSTSGKG